MTVGGLGIVFLTIFDVDYRALELGYLRSNKSLVQRAEEQMGNPGLFAE